MDLHKPNFRPIPPTPPTLSNQNPVRPPSEPGMWQQQSLLFNDEQLPCFSDPHEDLNFSHSTGPKMPKTARNGSRRPMSIGLPRQTTFKRQNSEQRDRLYPVESQASEKRALSLAPGVAHEALQPRSLSSPAPLHNSSDAAPAVGHTAADAPNPPLDSGANVNGDGFSDSSERGGDNDDLPSPRPASVTSSNESYERQRDALDERAQLNAELDSRWILNLSMHFRDMSDREKFFVTFAETPNKWRRVTVSVDYRNAEPGSLEMDLKELSLQRDKSLQIYEAIRESLAEIQFYESVTNLKLETSDGRLHVHVTEDVNEIVPYPPRSSLTHVLEYGPHIPMECRESDLSFETHLSGFVYKVKYKRRTLIKKEIPGPDTVDEFLYEVNALHALTDSKYIIHLEGIVLDDSYTVIKGLLISYAEKGAVVDLLYDLKGEIPWERRQRWAKHAVAGLSDVHEEGYVQGDFTLSNIVVDNRDNARIIDINRRGCPVGWEPPELAQKIASNQRISMYIGQKSDLYQLGMSLWALAMDDDEPERHDPPLSTQVFPTDIPEWYVEIVRICLSPRPRDRLSAKALLEMFPDFPPDSSYLAADAKSLARLRTQKQYIDPQSAVERSDLERFANGRNLGEAAMYSPQSSRDDYTFTYPRSSNDDRDYHGSISEYQGPRSRRREAGDDDELFARYEDLGLQHPGHESPPLVGRIPMPVGYDDAYESDEDLDHFGPGRFSAYDASDDGERRRGRSPGDRIPCEKAVIPSDSFDQSSNAAETPHTRSQLSEPTPRSSAVHLASPGERLSNAPPSSVTADSDLAYLGAHPNVHSEQDALSNGHISESETQSADFRPPRLQFVDSGFNEPGVFGMVQRTVDQGCEGNSDMEMEQNLAESRRNRFITPNSAESATLHRLTDASESKMVDPAGQDTTKDVPGEAETLKSNLTSTEKLHSPSNSNSTLHPDSAPNSNHAETQVINASVVKDLPP